MIRTGLEGEGVGSGRGGGAIWGLVCVVHWGRSRWPMHSVFFGLKRVMYGLRKTFKRRLDRYRLKVTPAQYDVLRILCDYRCGLARFVLVRLLGVSGPVVSR